MFCLFCDGAHLKYILSEKIIVEVKFGDGIRALGHCTLVSNNAIFVEV